VEIPQALEGIVANIEKAGGQPYLVGGAVIDLLRGMPAKDFDIEVYRLSLNDLKNILSAHGRPNLVGESFGIIKLRIGDSEYDFNIPRKESRIGVGHTDFKVDFVPDISLEEAALRRDLTINSMCIDLRNGTLHDFFNGRQDLQAGIIRHTSEKFSEDPLRVLRVMQLLARKGKAVAPETLELCRHLAGQYETIAKERIFEEWNKLLMKAEKPSMGLQFLLDCEWIKYYPELDALRDTPQKYEWHPEGTVWNHTLLATDAAAQLREKLPEEWKRAYMYGVMLHDVGKPSTTSEELTSHGHAEKGAPIAKQFMRRLTDDVDLIDKVFTIVHDHLRPGQLCRSGAPESAWKRLHNDIPLNVIAYVSKADSTGRAGRSHDDLHMPSELALKYFEKYGAKKIPPVLMGRDLIAAGYAPGKIFGEVLSEAYQIQIDEGIADKNVLLDRVKHLLCQI